MTFRTDRRAALKLLLGGAAAALPLSVASFGASATTVRLGAIRWDAWYGADRAPKSPEWYATHDLDPPAYRRRAPFFARMRADGRFVVNGRKDDMNAEIRYAARAGLNYWAFDWYPTLAPMHSAWSFYQESPLRTLVNWCLLVGVNTVNQGLLPTRQALSYFAQGHYEKVGARPLLYLNDTNSPLSGATQWIAALRAACAAAGMATPYVVVLCASANRGAQIARTVRADAIGAYASAPKIENGPRPYSALDAYTRTFWHEMANTGLQIVPNGMTGWDRRPRIQNPPPFDRIVATMDQYITPGAPAQIADHIGALSNFIAAHPRSCAAGTGLIYSWNECDEGGSVLCPTWTPNGPDHRILDAVAAVTRPRYTEGAGPNLPAW